GLPPLRLFGRRPVRSDQVGQAELLHGAVDVGAGGELWLLRTDQAPLLLRAGADGVLRPATNVGVGPAHAALALLRPGPTKGAEAAAGPGPDLELHASGDGQGQRLQRVAEVPESGGFVTVHRDGSPVSSGAAAMVFLREGSSEVVFLGVCSGGALPFAVPRGGYTLVAIDPQGRLGQLQVRAADRQQQPRLSIPLQAPCSLLLSDALAARARAAGGVVYLRFQRGQDLGGPLYLTRQVRAMDSGELSGLLPGSYQISFGDGTSVTRMVR
ncbi:MAG: hypothetical protein V3U11_06090, partial [Planctomycetota bacterium]